MIVPTPKRDRRLWLAGASLFAALLWSANLLLERSKLDQAQARLEATRGQREISSAEPVAGGQEPGLGVEVHYTSLSRDHTLAQVRYALAGSAALLSPPVGGSHRPGWANCGLYEASIQPEAAVHSMEHGAVWITYRPDLEVSQRLRLALLRRLPRAMISPYRDQSTSVVVTAWGVQLRLNRADTARLEQFYNTYHDAATAPEPEGPCVGGTGVSVTSKEASR
jgi:Protein of unknown function (DUF3105)